MKTNEYLQLLLEGKTDEARKVRGVGKCLHEQNSSRTIYDRLCEIRNLLS